MAFAFNRSGMSIGLALLGLPLGIVDFAAVAVQSLQQTLTITFAQALALLNVNVVSTVSRFAEQTQTRSFAPPLSLQHSRCSFYPAGGYGIR